MNQSNKDKYRKRSLILIVILLLGLMIPLPYFVEVPGTAEQTRNIVTIDGKRDDFEGEYLMTTVALEPGFLLNLIRSVGDPNASIYSKKELIGGTSIQNYDEQQAMSMQNSQQSALELVLTKAKYPFEKISKGVKIMAISPDSAFYEELEVGDLIVAANGKKVTDGEDLKKVLEQVKPKESVKIEFERNHESLKASGKLVKLEGMKKPGIGISLMNDVTFKTDKKINFNLEDVGGPSGGLMFSLELYGMLAEIDLTNGQVIAGTGTIDAEGNIGQIGGIDKKVVAAEDAGATLFLAPELSDKDKEKQQSNYEEALESVAKNHLRIKVIPVKTFDEAIEALKKNK